MIDCKAFLVLQPSLKRFLLMFVHFNREHSTVNVYLEKIRMQYHCLVYLQAKSLLISSKNKLTVSGLNLTYLNLIYFVLLLIFS